MILSTVIVWTDYSFAIIMTYSSIMITLAMMTSTLVSFLIVLLVYHSQSPLNDCHYLTGLVVSPTF